MSNQVKGGFMKNIILDITMGLLCLVLAITIIGMVMIPVVLESWEDMRD